ncbi:MULTISPECIES: ABC transporter permease [Lederbergia]|uniref:ABC transporter permease n=2 Tax=Lederbergia TaxID=2804231 RepID=A0A178A060_9BACI|nr:MULTISPECIES: ABC transporter permease [Lederbergia]KRG13135.1 ABC transporter permease [Virgibacillus soli]MBP1916446.1 peptide/nickel transport system permease protein [Lederbergia galactosidilytica]OAK73512.1 ABC transporter permease [Lederbergia galactosidilytica]GIN59073.1 ABC transporter permease [Lederbergia ruris]
MLHYIGHRVLQLIPLIIAISIISFALIQLPPGDYLTTYINQLELSGTEVSEGTIMSLQRQYGLDKPMYAQYFIWIKNIVLHGDFGRSFTWNEPVSDVIGERLGLTIVISILTLILTWIIAIPIGIYSAIRQYSIFDYIFTFIGFIGLAIPNFLIALFVIYTVFVHTGVAITGLFSPEYVSAPWSIDKILDMLQRIWVPVLIIAVSGTAGLIRVMRGMLLDELQKQYVITARAKGVKEKKLLFKYPVRMAINPIISTIGWTLPAIISGEAIVSIVLNLPTTGPMLLEALMNQDMYLAGSFILLLSILTIIGTLISDILLAWLDPRIRFGGVEE